LKRIIFLVLFLVSANLFAQSNEDCMDCHIDEDLTRTVEQEEISMHVDVEILANSIHDGLECIDCHSDIEELPHDEHLLPADCSSCHDDIQEEYQMSVHGEGGIEKDVPFSAKCQDCHGAHHILSGEDIGSQVNRQHLSKTCGKCHSRPEMRDLFGRRRMDPVKSYEQSVHGQKLKSDPDSQAATCVDCHGSHKILLPLNPESSFGKLELPYTCGKCHEEERDEFLTSNHWKAVTRGFYQSPVCNDCHGEHLIASPKKNGSATHGLSVSSELCSKCHSNETMMNRFGLDAERFNSYKQTYHGLAVMKGSPDAANCVSCHEMHGIRSSLDSLSSVHPDNLKKTCGKCHDKISTSFIQIDMHPKNQKTRNPIAYMVKVVYYWLIALTIGGMLVHNLIIYIYYVVEKWRKEKKMRMIKRFTMIDVTNHILLAVSFSMLAATGFALKFPDSMWVEFLTFIGMSEVVRGALHRISAVILIASGLAQCLYFVAHKNGRRDIWALRPTIDDLTAAIQNMLFYLRLSKKHPRSGRFDYTEKAEYLALIWGTAVMAITGFVLWMPELFMNFLPSWMFEVCEMIHYYEAWLATLAILIWHGFFVMLHPEKYPMSFTKIHGKITEEEFKHHHSLEWEQERE